MKRQILKGFTMFTLIVAVALMTAVASANAQSAPTVIANVPFEFNVGGKVLPAGQYTVRAITAAGGALAITSRDSGVMRLTQTIEARKAPEKSKLVFHRYGQRYFLSQVWTAGNQTGRELRKSKQERALEGQLAAIPSKSDLARSSYDIVEIVALVR